MMSKTIKFYLTVPQNKYRIRNKTLQHFIWVNILYYSLVKSIRFIIF